MDKKTQPSVEIQGGADAPAYESPRIETREAADLDGMLLDVNAFTGDPFEL